MTDTGELRITVNEDAQIVIRQEIKGIRIDPVVCSRSNSLAIARAVLQARSIDESKAVPACPLTAAEHEYLLNALRSSKEGAPFPFGGWSPVADSLMTKLASLHGGEP